MIFLRVCNRRNTIEAVLFGTVKQCINVSLFTEYSDKIQRHRFAEIKRKLIGLLLSTRWKNVRNALPENNNN